jgi:hypothetical protein
MFVSFSLLAGDDVPYPRVFVLFDAMFRFIVHGLVSWHGEDPLANRAIPVDRESDYPHGNGNITFLVFKTNEPRGDVMQSQVILRRFSFSRFSVSRQVWPLSF